MGSEVRVGTKARLSWGWKVQIEAGIELGLAS